MWGGGTNYRNTKHKLKLYLDKKLELFETKHRICLTLLIMGTKIKMFNFVNTLHFCNFKKCVWSNGNVHKAEKYGDLLKTTFKSDFL